MTLDGYVLKLDLTEVRKILFLLSNATNNINQIAKRANETGSVYKDDIKILQDHYDTLWGKMDKFLKSFAKL